MLDMTRRTLDPDSPGRLVYACLFMWTVIAVVAATTVFIALGASTWTQWLVYAYYMLAYFYTWGALAFGIHWLTGRLRFEGRNAVAAAVAHFGILLILTLTLPLLLHPLSWREWLYGEHAVGFHALNAFVYAFILITSMLVRYYRISRTRERESVAAELRNYELQTNLSEARVDALRSQINPHFLFNTLNAISSLIEINNNEEAIRVTGLLGSLLRTALYESSSVFFTLQEELDFLQRYVEIEKIRFGDKFVFETRVAENCLDIPVPSLFLQPLVENAVKYAVSPSSSPVRVQLRARRVADWLEITVSDDGPGLRELYASLQLVNECFSKRIRAAAKRDASMNALVNLFAVSVEVSLSLDEGLQDLARLYDRPAQR